LNIDEAEEYLGDYLYNGLASEIFWAEQAHALAEEIGRHANQINDANYGQLFGAFQAILSDRQTLAIAKIFDPPSNRFPTRSIPAILNHLEVHADLWKLPDRQKLHEELAKGGVDITLLEKLSAPDLTRAVVSRFQSTLPSRSNVDRLSLSLEALRESRNKVIAHNEAVDPATRRRPTWGDATPLVNYAKHFVSTVGRGFLGIHFEINGQFLLTEDAHRNSRALNRFFRAAGLAPDSA